MNRYHAPVSLLQASQSNPDLAKLMELQRESSARLQAISGLIPESLRAGIKAGPIDEKSWCLIFNNNNTAAKLRQLLPALEAHLRVKGLGVNAIRLKVSHRTF
jgi:hypothetical protein